MIFMQMALIGKEEEEESKKRKEKERKKEEAPKAPDILERKDRIERGMDKDVKHGELRTVSKVEHPEFKAILDTGEIYTKREAIVKEVEAVRMTGEEEEKKGKGPGIKIEKTKEEKKVKEKQAREQENRKKEFIQREAKKRAIKEKKDIKEIAEELRRKGIITSSRSRMVVRSRREHKKLKLIKKLLSKIKVRMK